MRRHIKVRTSVLVISIVLMAAGYSPAQTWHTVKWVDDGDTIILATGQRVRYIGINAPEIDHADQKAQPYGYKAMSFNKNLVMRHRIRLEFDTERYDQYGRMLAYIFLPDGSCINSRLLQNGLAFYLYRWPNVKYEKILFKEQLEAMASRKGLWCNWKEKSGRYIGNPKSRRFHLAACPLAGKIRPSAKLEFASKWDAFQAGYAPAKECVVQFWSYEEGN